MKLDTIIIISKGLAFVLVGVFGPWMAALSQWIGDGTWPPKIIWIGVILPLSVVGAANAWIAFTSGSWKEFRQQKLADDTGTPIATTVQPTPPKVEP